MPILRDFERRLGGLVEGLFAKTFRSGLQPVELAKRILREMDAGKTLGVKDVWAPNNFIFSLSPTDGERFEQAEAALAKELAQVVRDNAAERGWGLVGPAHVGFQIDDALKKGEFRCEATLVEGEDRIEPAPTSGALLQIRDEEGERTVRLSGGVATIGRLPECEIVVHDPGASRRHAQIRLEDGTYTVTDLGSTNGTTLNGQTVKSRGLVDGDRIRIGNSVLEFHAEG